MASSSSTRGLRAASCSALAMSRCARCTACAVCEPLASRGVAARSEEHTSELQSPCNLVCRLLLEKKTSPLNAYDAHRMPVPSLEPLDETDKTAPLCPVGPTPLNTTWLCGSNRLLPPSNGMARNGSFSDQM